MTGTVAGALARLAEQLSAQLDLAPREARLEARVLAAAAWNVAPVWLLAHDRDPLTPARASALDRLAERRLAGEPVAYVLGRREFYGRIFEVTPDTLIPRPETELLVEAALARMTEPGHLLDVGTGSGCLALTLKLERPDWTVTGSDIAPAALAVAARNGQRLGADVDWRVSDLLAGLADTRFELIVSNPPYIPETDAHLDRGDLRFEPRSALASGGDGLDHLRALIDQAPARLTHGGWLLLEHGYDQGDRVPALLRGRGYAEVFMTRDLAGHARVSGGRWP